MSQTPIHLQDAPPIPGLRFRRFQGEGDYVSMASVLTGSENADHVARTVTAENMAAAFDHALVNCDPTRDMILAEVDGKLVGYGRAWWEEETPTLRLYKHNAFLLPDWRRKGIGWVLLRWLETRLAAVAGAHPPDSQKYLQANVSQHQTGTIALLEAAGYQPVRCFFTMVRPNLEDIPDHPLPTGVEIRPVSEEHYPAIWTCLQETSQDEWGYTPATEEAYQEWLEHPHFQPYLWQIAWDQATGQAVGTVLTYIDHQENQQMGLQRGHTEDIGVTSHWRRRGVARALIARSLQAQKDAGMTESALTADSESVFEVVRLYESCGFQIVNRDTIYRKSL